MYLDFFSTNVQRTAVKTAANCCRGIAQDSISMVQDILPNLENIMQYSDQKIVEHACLCFVRLADSFKSNAAHLQVMLLSSCCLLLLFAVFYSTSNIKRPTVFFCLAYQF